jgi:hypothetical protein
MKKLLVGLLMAFVSVIISQFTLVTSAIAQGSFQIYMAVGPRSGEIGYQQFVGEMMEGIKGNASQVVFLQSGTTVDIKSIVSCTNLGSALYMGFQVKSDVPFTFDQLSRCVGSYLSKGTNPMVATSFGSSLSGKDPYGTTYPYGSPVSGAQLSEVNAIANLLSFNVANFSDAEIQRAVSSYQRLNGGAVEYTAQYSLNTVSGTISGQSSVVLVPEPSTWIILLVGGVGFLFMKRR